MGAADRRMVANISCVNTGYSCRTGVLYSARIKFRRAAARRHAGLYDPIHLL